MKARWLPVALAAACAHVEAPPTLKDWVAANADSAEPVICQREVHGEYFFVARRPNDDKLKLGSRVDLTGYRETLSLSVAWKLRNEHGSFITAKIVPTEIKSELLRIEEKIYAENIEYQTISVGASKLLRVEVAVEKCPVWPCSQESSDAKRYELEICETAL
jgi:hypothetical protein